LNSKVVDGGKKLLCNNPYILLSSQDLEFMEKFVGGCFGIDYSEDIKFVNNDFIKVHDFYGGYNFFKTVGTGVLLKSKGASINANDKSYSKKLKESILRKYKLVHGKEYNKDFSIDISKYLLRNVIVKHNKNIVSDIVFKLSGDKDISEFIYYNGIGKSTGSGFGMLVRN
jgi:CRISPR-associated endoribonuclease Cas6